MPQLVCSTMARGNYCIKNRFIGKNSLFTVSNLGKGDFDLRSNWSLKSIYVNRTLTGKLAVNSLLTQTLPIFFFFFAKKSSVDLFLWIQLVQQLCESNLKLLATLWKQWRITLPCPSFLAQYFILLQNCQVIGEAW